MQQGPAGRPPPRAPAQSPKEVAHANRRDTHITLNMLRQDPNTKRSIRHRRLKAALSQEYRLAALLGFPGETPIA